MILELAQYAIMNLVRSKIVAEGATCHGGSVEEAKRLIDAAKASGVDTIKFQLIEPSKLYVRSSYEAPGVLGVYAPFEARTKEVISHESWISIAKYAKESEIEIAFTFFDIDSLAILNHLEVPFLKVASGDINHLELLKAMSKFNLPVVLSTGMSTEEDIEKALLALGNSDVTLLHCVSLYPCEIANAQIERVQVLKKFGKEVGFSDHTMGNSAALLAHSLGARFFEKHFKLDDSPVTADFYHSINPSGLTNYVQDIRQADNLLELKNGQIEIDSKFDLTTKVRARRSFYFARSLPKGTTISHDDIKFVRPFFPGSVSDASKIVELVTNCDVLEDFPVLEEFLNPK